MPLGPEILLQLVKDINLVENLDQRELTNPEGAGFDLRVGEIHVLDEKGKAFLGITERQTPETKVVAKYEEGKKVTYVLKPGDYALMKTIETVNLPKDLCGYNFTRSTLFRSGLTFYATQIAPGYKGPLIFGLKNDGPVEVTIEMGARLAHIQFERVEGGGSEYRGQWQGGRVAAVNKETQV